jgi:dolichol-phosphate mannosyltransferase
VFVAFLILLPVAVSLIVAGSRRRVAHAPVCSEPRELIRRALAVIPSHSDDRALRHAVDLARRADPRVDVVVIEGTPDRALRAGAARGLVQQYDAVIELSVEHAGLTQRITRLLDALEDGAHVAIGSRYVPGGCVLGCRRARRLASRGANSLLHWCTRLPLHDVTAPIRAYRRAAIEHAVLHAGGRGRSFGLEVLLRCHNAGLRLAEVPVAAAGATCATSLAESCDLFARAFRWRRPDALRGDGPVPLSALGYEPLTRVV